MEIVGGVEVIEQDTVDSEDVQDIVNFVLPDPITQQTALNLGFSFNRRVFRGWVRQPSPCCGAASVAGSWNALLGLHRSDGRALNHLDVLNVYSSLFVNKISKQIQSFDRKFGSVLAESLIVLLSAEWACSGRGIGAKKGSSVTKKVLNTSILRMAKQFRQQHPASVGGEEKGENAVKADAKRGGVCEGSAPSAGCGHGGNDIMVEEEQDERYRVMKMVVDQLEFDGINLSSTSTADSAGLEEVLVAEGKEDSEDSEDEGEEDGEEDKAKEVKKPSTSSSSSTRKISSSSSAWDWKKDLYVIVKNLAGLFKLNAEKPNTAAIGNLGILQAVEEMAAWSQAGSTLRARLLVGKKKAQKNVLEVNLSAKDSEDVKAAQWATIREHFSRPDTVLLFHLRNHFALIFALREWTESPTSSSSSVATADPTLSAGPVVRRQILCARRGQRPTAWVDFDEARQTMLGWEGYKVMSITLAGAVGVEDRRAEQMKLSLVSAAAVEKDSPERLQIARLMRRLNLWA